jgi:AcrR family transcriptional regulator
MPATPRTKKEKQDRPRRPALTRERIVEAALALADTRGDFSMRALGQRLRVDPMAIYRHFRDKDSLLDAMVDAALGELAAPPAESGDALARLRRMCVDFRACLDAHPGVALRVSTTRPTLGPHTVSLTEACLGLLREMGLDSHEATRAFLMIIRFITGVAAADGHVRAEGLSEASWREDLRAGYASVSPAEHPNVAAMAEVVGDLGLQEEFEYGLDLLLDGLSRRGAAAR